MLINGVFANIHSNKTKQLEINNTKQRFIKIKILRLI